MNRTERRAVAKQTAKVERKVAKLAIETVDVRPTEGALVGHWLRMRFPSARWFIQQKRGFTSDDDNAIAYYEEILDAIEEHDLGRDPAGLPARYVLDIGRAWMAAIRDLAVPPTTGSDSEKPSPSLP